VILLGDNRFGGFLVPVGNIIWFFSQNVIWRGLIKPLLFVGLIVLNYVVVFSGIVCLVFSWFKNKLPAICLPAFTL
jgi:hypothetical protein